MTNLRHPPSPKDMSTASEELLKNLFHKNCADWNILGSCSDCDKLMQTILKHFISIESVREACKLEAVNEFSSTASESIEPMFRNRAKSQILQTLEIEEES